MKYQSALSSLRYKRAFKFALIGNEPYLKEDFIKASEIVYPDEDMKKIFPENQAEAYDILSSQGLFEDGLLILCNFNKMKTAAFEDVINGYRGCLILSFSEGANIKSRAMTKILTSMVIVECKKLREYGTDYPIWIRSQITDAEYGAEPNIENLIFARIGPNMFALSRELEKLFVVKSKDDVITSDDVREYVSVTSMSTAFELFENLMRKDVNKALHCFDSYTRNKNTFTDVVGFLGTYFEKMYRMLLLRESKLEVADVADIIGIPKFLVTTKYLPKALSFGKHGIASKINALCYLDVQMRLFKGDKRILFEKFITDFK